MKSLNSHQYINIVESRVTCSPPTIQCRDYSVIHEFDISMSKFSIGMFQGMMVDRLISKVSVKRKISGFATYTVFKNQLIIADLLAINGGLN